MERLPAERFKTPEEEIAFLRKELAIKRAENRSHKEPTAVIREYSRAPIEAVLPPERVMPERHAKMVALNLEEEKHDDRIGELLSMVLEKGIRNVLEIAEKLNDPHLLDDLHRALVAYLAAEEPAANFTEKDPLWRPLHMTLFEVHLPEAEETNREKSLSELISGMEQFYSGMMSVAESGRSRSWFTIEIANENGSEEFAFYIAVPNEHARLMQKQLLAIFPNAIIAECRNDYNIFNEQGVSVAAHAALSKHALYPLKPYEEFDIDPLNIILNSFSKIDKEGEGAAIQFLIGPKEEDYTKRSRQAVEGIKKGESVSTALAEIDRGLAMQAVHGLFSVFKSTERTAKEKEKKVERAGQVDQTMLEQFSHKLKYPLAGISLRVVASAKAETDARAILDDITAGFNQFEDGDGNQLEWKENKGKDLHELLKNFSLRNWAESEKMVWNLEEMTTVMHLPSVTPSKAVPQLRQAKAASAPPPLQLPKEGTLLGKSHFRGQESEVRIALEDRLRHFYIIGQTGTGKTTLMKNMIAQDIAEGHGVCFIDPHGNDIADVLSSVPESRRDDVIYFDPARTDRVLGLNMLEFDPERPEQKTFVVNELFSIFQKLYGGVPESMGPMFEQYFRNATLLVLEDPESGSTLLDISRVFADASYRAHKLSKARNPVIVQFWNDIATKAGGEASLENIVPYITSKFDIFTANDFMRPIIGQQKSSFNFRQLMDERKILLVNLSKGRLGEINANLIGMIIVGKILMAALSRVDDLTGQYPPFFLHMDEFQNVTTDSIAVILSEARKYKLGLTVAHQFIAQLDEKIRDAVFGNVGSLATFRVGPEDAEFLEKQFAPAFSAKDLMNIENRQAYLRILMNGTPQKPFNISTLPPTPADADKIKALVENSYQKYGRPRRQIELEISARYL